MLKSTSLLVLTCAIVCVARGTAAGDDATPDYLQGSGIMFRGDHIEGQGIPQIRSITPIELFPYIIQEQSLFFGDLRVFPTNDFTVGGNAGLGYRYYSEGLDRVFGISGWYDGDNTRQVLFQQLGLSLESYAGPFDVRSNLYLPVGPLNRQSSLTLINGSTQFIGDNLVFNQFRSWISAMKGFDAEAGTLVPGDFAEEHGIRVYAGGYHFSDNQGDDITGASGRIQANLIAGLDAQVQVTYDNFFRTRAFIGFSYTFGALHRSELKQTTAYGRIGEHVTRNYTVVAEGHRQIEQQTAIDPATGNPYTFAHVASGAAAGGNGTIASPFNNIAAAQLAGREIIFVHAGSVFSGANASLVLNPGDRILGDGSGIQHALPVAQFGSLFLPQGAGSLPVLSGSIGNSVVLANNTEFSGFAIKSAGGSGIVGSGVQNVVLNNVVVNGPVVDGIQLVNTAGPVTITNASVINSGGSGINLQGGTGPIQFLGTTTISGAGGPAVLIHNLASTGSITFGDLAIDHRHGMGIESDGSGGNVAFTGATNITNELGSTASAIDIRNSTGNASFNLVNAGATAAASGSAGVNLQNDAGTTSFSTLNISSQSGTALRANGAGNLVINPAVNNQVNLAQGGMIAAADGAALDIQNTNLNVNLTSVSSNHAATAGVSLINTAGFLAVFGNGTAGSGGVIQNAPIGILLQNTGLTGFRYMTIDSNGVGIGAQNVASLLIASSSITNSATFGIDALNTPSLSIANSTLMGNGSANIRGQFSLPGTYSYTIIGTQLTSATSDNIDLTVLAGGQGSTMNLVAQNDTLINSHALTSGINVGWNGTLSASVDNSNFAMSGGTNTGMLINNASTSGLTSVSLTNSTFLSTGGADTGANLIAAGPSRDAAECDLAGIAGVNEPAE